MTEQTPPPIDKFASCPYNGKILSYYEGQFDCVYILLHPFIKPINIEIERFCPETYPSKQEIIAGCKPASWQEVLQLTGLPSLSAIDIGLRTIMSGLKQEFVNKEFAEQIDALVQQHHIVYPSEGDLPELLENRILRAIKTLGHNWLWVGDEFGTERKLC